jgi:hypothetical protein
MIITRFHIWKGVKSILSPPVASAGGDNIETGHFLRVINMLNLFEHQTFLILLALFVAMFFFL